VINQYYCSPQLPATPFSFSILVTSPIRRDLQFSPVSAMILPLASIKLHFASMIIVGLDMLMSFLFKRVFGSSSKPIPHDFNSLSRDPDLGTTKPACACNHQRASPYAFNRSIRFTCSRARLWPRRWGRTTFPR